MTKPFAKSPRGRRVSTRVVERTDRTTLPLFASAMRRAEPARDLVRVEGRPAQLSCGLPSVDRALGGGLPVGGATLVAARPRVGATSFLITTGLAALKRGERVAYFSERLREDQLRGRFVVLESRVNGYRFRAGFVSAEDRLALAAARERLPWNALSLTVRRQISMPEIDGHIFSYRPWLVLVDIHPRAPGARGPARYDSVYEGVQRLAGLARRHQVALLLRWILPRGSHPPNLLELPHLGELVEPFTAAVLLHREDVDHPEDESGAGSGLAEAHVVRTGGHAIEPRVVPLRFDQRFAGLLERSQ